MNAHSHPVAITQTARYVITVPGHLNPCWAEQFDGMGFGLTQDGCGRPLTTLTGWVDQARLHSLLRQLYGLGLPLLSVVCIDLPQPTRGPNGREEDG